MPSVLSVFFDADGQIDLDMNRVQTRAIEARNKRPGFFTPHEDFSDFAYTTFAAPVIEPMIMGITSVVMGLVSTCSALVSIGSFLFAGGAALFGQSDLATAACAVGVASGLISLAVGLAGFAFALGTLYSIPETLVKSVTRTVSTVISPLVNCCRQNNEESDESTHLGLFPTV